MDYSNYTQEQLNEKLVSAAYNNNLPLIKELLTSPKLKLHAQINADSRFIGNICSNKDLNTLRYVLTSPELKEHADLHLDDERALCCAIYEVDIPMVKYLLTSPELKEHSNLYHKNSNDDNLAIEYIFKVREFAKSVKLIDYFTLDYAVEKKDANVFLKLIEFADDIDLEEQIAINLCNIIEKEQDNVHQCELKKTLKELDIDKYNMVNVYLFQKELKGELPENKKIKSKKMKV